MITNYLLAYTLINGVVYQITVSLCPASLMGTALTITVRRTSVRPCVCRVHIDVNTVKSVFTTMSDLEKLLARQIGENAKKTEKCKKVHIIRHEIQSQFYTVLSKNRTGPNKI